jgi:hypothetical protein
MANISDPDMLYIGTGQWLGKYGASEEWYELIEVILQLIRVCEYVGEEIMGIRLYQTMIRRYGRWSKATIKQLA